MNLKPRTVRIAALAALSVLAACGPGGADSSAPDLADDTGVATARPSAVVAVLEDAPSPVGGTVKRLVLGGPQATVLVVCDQGGFEPFLFTDQGDWVGCELAAGSEPGPGSALLEPVMRAGDSTDGDGLTEVVIPGPQSSILVDCETAGSVPILRFEGGTRVGCDSG